MDNKIINGFIPLDTLIYDISKFYALLMLGVGIQCTDINYVKNFIQEQRGRISGARIISKWHCGKYRVNIIFDKYIIENKPLRLFGNDECFYHDLLFKSIEHKKTHGERLKRFHIVLDIARSLIYNVRIESGYTICNQCKKIGHCVNISSNEFSNKLLCSECKKSTDVQQTQKEQMKSNGYVYILEAINMGFYKIGKTINLDSRMKSLIKLPFDVKLIHTIKTDNPTKTELELHRKFADLRVNGEWFKLSNESIEYLIKYQDETT